jgi:hypothetical protein
MRTNTWVSDCDGAVLAVGSVLFHLHHPAAAHLYNLARIEAFVNLLVGACRADMSASMRHRNCAANGNELMCCPGFTTLQVCCNQ